MSQPTVVITGGTRGLGRATTEQCLSMGANVVICSENQDDLDAGLAAIGPRVQLAGTVCDVSNLNDVRALMAFALEQYGHVDAWINNAGTTAATGKTTDVPLKMGEVVIGTNISGTYFGSIIALRYFRKKGQGRLINMLGRGRKRPTPTANMYASSKAWIRNFTVALSKEEKNSGIDIHTFNPGLLLTTLTGKPRLLKGYEGLVDTLKKVMLLFGDSNENAGRDLANLAINGQPGKVEIDRMRPGRFVPMILTRLLTGKRAAVDVSTIEPVVIEPETE